jgi:hypothetical protein
MLIIPATFAIQAHVIPPSAGNLAGGLNFSSQEFEDMTGPFGNDAASDSLKRIEIDLAEPRISPPETRLSPGVDREGKTALDPL